MLEEKRLFRRLSPTRFSGNRYLYVSSSGRSFFIFRYSVYAPGMLYPSAISRGHRAARFFSISAAKVHRTFTPDNEPRCFFPTGRPVKIFAPCRNFSKKRTGTLVSGGNGCYAIVYDKNPLSSCVIKGLRNDAGRCIPSIFEMAESK